MMVMRMFFTYGDDDHNSHDLDNDDGDGDRHTVVL